MSGGDWKDLYAAACAGDVDLVRFHAEGGVDLDHAHPEFQCTALVSCILAGQETSAGVLLDHGASPDLYSELDDATPLQAARRMRMDALAGRLLQLGARDDVDPAVASPSRPADRRRRWWRGRPQGPSSPRS